MEFAAAVAGVPWGRYFHAYGVATDTPEHLLDLAAGKNLDEVATHFASAIVHQGTVWSATPDALTLLIRGLREHPTPRAITDAFLAVLVEAIFTWEDVEAPSRNQAELALAAWEKDLATARAAADEDEALEIAFETFFERPESSVLYVDALNRIAALKPDLLALLDTLAERGGASTRAIEDARSAWEPIANPG